MSECPYCQNSFEMTEICHDEFRMWQGLVGPHYTPEIDEEGVLSWTNTGGLPNPDPIYIIGPAGASFSIDGIVDTVSQLPSGGAEGVWLVGTEAPYEGYSFVNGAWADIGQLAIGPQGPQGDPGQNGTPAGFGTPTATITNTTGTPSVTVTASGPDTAKVFAFAFENLKGAKGDTGSKGDPGEVTQAEFDSLADDVDELKTNLENATNIDASDWRSALGLGTSGALPITIAQGGTGQTGTTDSTTISGIATAGTNITITAASYTQWGKVAQIGITFKSSNTLTSRTVATIVSGKRPLHAALAGTTDGSLLGQVAANGNLNLKGNLAADTSATVLATYILA